MFAKNFYEYNHFLGGRWNYLEFGQRVCRVGKDTTGAEVRDGGKIGNYVFA
jgi:hypothetical protein